MSHVRSRESRLMMESSRLLFRVYKEVPYTIDLDAHPDSETEDGLLKMYFKTSEEIQNIIPYHDNRFGIPRWDVRAKIDKFDLTESEKWSVLSFFEDNNDCADDDFFITSYDDMFQCTGLLDVKGNLVFEGDRLKSEYVAETPVIWFNGAFVLDNPRFNLGQAFMYDSKLEVVGNIRF